MDCRTRFLGRGLADLAVSLSFFVVEAGFGPVVEADDSLAVSSSSFVDKRVRVSLLFDDRLAFVEVSV